MTSIRQPNVMFYLVVGQKSVANKTEITSAFHFCSLPLSLG